MACFKPLGNGFIFDLAFWIPFCFAGVRNKIVSFYFVPELWEQAAILSAQLSLGLCGHPTCTHWMWHPALDWIPGMCCSHAVGAWEVPGTGGRWSVPCCRAVTTVSVHGGQVSSTPGFLGQSWMQALGITCILMVQTSCAVFINVKMKCWSVFLWMKSNRLIFLIWRQDFCEDEFLYMVVLFSQMSIKQSCWINLARVRGFTCTVGLRGTQNLLS